MNANLTVAGAAQGAGDDDPDDVRASGMPDMTVGDGRVAAEQPDFASRLAEHRGILFKVATTYSFTAEERDDLVQEICLQLWRSYPSYDRARRFSTWMYRVALNTGISHARETRVRAARVVPLDDARAAAAAAPAQESDDRVERLYRVLRALPQVDRALVLLHLDDRSYREIAEVLGISETNVGTRISRLKQTLRQMAHQQENQHGTR
jgi:RNA polymerase sigma-70 factor (ECF subfamily)